MCASTITRTEKQSVGDVRATKQVGFAERHAGKLVLAIGIFAVVRIFVFCAVFPLFSPIDEPFHFDHVWQVSRGHVPADLEHIGPDPARLIALYSSPEYLSNPRNWPDGKFNPPLWSLPKEVAQPYVESFTQDWAQMTDHEDAQPPVYYALAAGWYRLGQAMGMSEGPAIHWIRFLNVLIYGLLVWVSYAFVRRFYPNKPFLWVGVPMLLAFMPQDLYYQIGNDSLSALLCALALYGLTVVCKQDRGIASHLLAGLAVAAAFLGKYTSGTIYLALAVVAGVKLIEARRNGSTRARRRVLAMLGAAALPVAAWFGRNYVLSRSLTLGDRFEQFAHWVPRPIFWDMWYHPIFSPQGASYYWMQLMALYWRGQFEWAGVPMAWRPLDLFYAGSSLAFLAIVTVMILRRRGPSEERLADTLSLMLFAGGVATLVGMSLHYDFGHWPNPSRELPYFYHGRLISGTLLPFAILYLKGLDALLAWIRMARYGLIVVLLLGIVVTCIEVNLSAPVFRSPFNWFHML